MKHQRVFVVMGWVRYDRPDFSTLRVFTTESEAWAFGRLLEGTLNSWGDPEWYKFTVDETELCESVPTLNIVNL